MISLSPRNQSCPAASRLAFGTRNSFHALGWRFPLPDGESGVSKRIEYGSVGCVPPVAWFPGAGGMFVGLRRLSYSGFGKVSSSQRRAARPRASSSSPPAPDQALSSPLRARKRHGRRYGPATRAGL